MGLLQRMSAAGARLAERVPWWLTAAIGALLGAAGAALVVRPFLSLAALIVLLSAALALQGAAGVRMRPGRHGSGARGPARGGRRWRWPVAPRCCW